MTSTTSERGCDRGAALVEFAIVLPVFLMMVLGAVDWGYFFVVREAVGNAAREGARGASVGDASAVPKQVTYLASLFPTASCAVGSAASAGPPASVTVTAHCDTVGSLSGVTEIPPFTWVQPPEVVTVAVTMRQ